MDKNDNNSCNFLFGPYVVPRAYAHVEFLQEVLNKVTPQTIHISAYGLAILAINDLVIDKLEPLFPIIRKFRHQVTLLYYNEKVTEPNELKYNCVVPNSEDQTLFLCAKCCAFSSFVSYFSLIKVYNSARVNLFNSRTLFLLYQKQSCE